MSGNASSQAVQELRFNSVNVEVCRPLGRGAFGEVFLVRAVRAEEPHTGDGHLLALKRVSVGQLSEAGAEKAKEEARLLQRLGNEHESILRCFDFRLLPAGTTPGSAQPVLELLLEFAPLGDLSGRIRAHRDAQADVGLGTGLPELEVIAYGRDLASGLAHLHALRPKVFHRDVKPANVVLFYGRAEASGRAGIPRAKLADFGIAKVLECEGTLAGAATVIGTPHYFSPEICRGERYDERADSWALGCVLYEMVCLRRPFHQFESNIAVLALRISEGRYDKDTLKRQASAYNGLLIFTLFGLLTLDQESRSRASDAEQSLRDLQNEATLSTAENVDSWWQAPQADGDASENKDELGEQPQAQGTNASVIAGSDSWGGAVVAEVPDVVTQLPSEIRAERAAAGFGAAELNATVVTELGSEIESNFAGGTFRSERLDLGTEDGSPETCPTLAGTFRINVAYPADEVPTASHSTPLHENQDQVRPFSALPQHDEPLTVRSLVSDADGEHDPAEFQSTHTSTAAEPAKKVFSTAPLAPPAAGLSRESSVPQTEMLGEVFFASGSQGGSASKCAWAGSPTSHRPNITMCAEESAEAQDASIDASHAGLPPEAYMDASSAGTRLLLRPMWPPGGAGTAEGVDAPVVFLFQPIVRPCGALPSADGDVADYSGVEVASDQVKDIQTSFGPGWLEVHFTPQGNEIVVPSGEAEDPGPIFSLTSLE